MVKSEEKIRLKKYNKKVVLMISEQTFVWTTLVFVAIMVFYVGLLIYRQYSEIDYYEKQGIFVFPGSKRPIVGMVKEIKSYF